MFMDLGKMSAAELNAMEAKFEQATAQRNTLKESEFVKFLPLFRANKLSPERLHDLMEDYKERVSLFHPIQVISDSVDDHGKSTMIIQLPPMFGQVDAINTLPDSDSLVNAFVNAISEDNPLSTRPERMTMAIQQRLQLAIDHSKNTARQAIYNQIMDDLKAKAKDPDATTTTTATEQPVDMSGWNWS